MARAPEPLTRLRIHVRNASDDRAREAEERVTGYTIKVRGAVQDALVRAGYVVVVRPEHPHDLVALVDTEHHHLGAVRDTLTTSLTLRAPEGVIEQRAGVVAIDENVDIDARGVIELVESLARSPSLRAYAEALPQGLKLCRPTQQLATDPAPARAAAAAAVTAGPGPSLAEAGVQVRNLASPGAFEVVNTGGEPIELAWSVEVEWLRDDRWQDRGVRDLYLIAQCGTSQDAPCATLAAGESLRPVPWSGFDCASQCGPPCRGGVCGAMQCHRNGSLPGTYRLVASTCDQRARFVGEAFVLPERPPMFDSR